MPIEPVNRKQANKKIQHRSLNCLIFILHNSPGPLPTRWPQSACTTFNLQAQFAVYNLCQDLASSLFEHPPKSQDRPRVPHPIPHLGPVSHIQSAPNPQALERIAFIQDPSYYLISPHLHHGQLSGPPKSYIVCSVPSWRVNSIQRQKHWRELKRKWRWSLKQLNNSTRKRNGKAGWWKDSHRIQNIRT